MDHTGWDHWRQIAWKKRERFWSEGPAGPYDRSVPIRLLDERYTEAPITPTGGVLRVWPDSWPLAALVSCGGWWGGGDGRDSDSQGRGGTDADPSEDAAITSIDATGQKPSGSPRGNTRARWSILARPSAYRVTMPAAASCGQTNNEGRRGDAAGVSEKRGGDPIDDLPGRGDHSGFDVSIPFAGGWIGTLSYELGGYIEPAARCSMSDRAGDAVGRPIGSGGEVWPLMCWARCEEALVYDAAIRRWYHVGTDDALVGLLGLAADQSAMPSGVRVARSCSGVYGSLADSAAAGSLGFVGAVARERYEDAVRRTINYIAMGDIYQANIAHRLNARLAAGDTSRALFGRMLMQAVPWYGAYIEIPETESVGKTVELKASACKFGRAIVSASPELFLRYDASTRRVETRPMKGTSAAEAGAEGLNRSEKDRAELAMIVDLMRNDLGRVCEIGSVRVEEARVIERHGLLSPSPASTRPLRPNPPVPDACVNGPPFGETAAKTGGVLQGVATVSGRLRPDADLRDLLRATFPPGSVTGAPKVRAMQIIAELEDGPRDGYCGAIGYISDSGDAQFSVTIRTAITRGCPVGTEKPQLGVSVTYRVGAGIVSDSVPATEWNETLIKARPLLLSLDSADAWQPERASIGATDVAAHR